MPILKKYSTVHGVVTTYKASTLWIHQRSRSLTVTVYFPVPVCLTKHGFQVPGPKLGPSYLLYPWLAGCYVMQFSAYTDVSVTRSSIQVGHYWRHTVHSYCTVSGKTYTVIKDILFGKYSSFSKILYHFCQLNECFHHKFGQILMYSYWHHCRMYMFLSRYIRKTAYISSFSCNYYTIQHYTVG